MSDQNKPEFHSVFAWFKNRKTKIGYAYLTDRGTMRLKGDNHLDAMKLGRALMSGIEIEHRPPQRQSQGQQQLTDGNYECYADQFDQTANTAPKAGKVA